MVETEAPGEASETSPDGEPPIVHAHRTSPDRVVLTEEGNSDGWIATDLVVEPPE